MHEIWRTIPGYSDYKASNLGRIKSFRLDKKRGRILAAHGRRYLAVCLGRGHHRYVHHLVMLAFGRGSPPSGQERRHRNGNRADCSIRNLRFGTHSQNMMDARRHGTMPQTVLRGEENGMARLTTVAVLEMRQRRRAGEPIGRLAREVGVTHSTARRAISGETWKHV